MTNKHWMPALIAVLVVACITSAAWGADYKLTMRGPLPSVTGKVWLDGPDVWQNVYIGPVWIDVLNIATNELYTQRMLCVDLLGQIKLNQTWYANLATGVPSGVVNAHAWDMAVWMAQNNPGWAMGWPSGSAAVQDAAIQIAIWEVIRDDTNWNLGAGSFKLYSSISGASRTDVANMAKAFFDAANPPTGYAADHPWFDAIGSGQDLVFFIPERSEVVPEIPAALLAPMGLGIIAAVRRKLAK